MRGGKKSYGVLVGAICAAFLGISAGSVVFCFEPDYCFRTVSALFVLLLVFVTVLVLFAPEDKAKDTGFCLDKADGPQPDNEAVLRPAGDFSDEEKKEIIGLLDEFVIKFAIEQRNFWREVCCDRRAGTIPLRKMGRLDNQKALFYALDAFHEIPVKIRYMRDGWFDDYVISFLYYRLGSFVSFWGGTNLQGLKVSEEVLEEFDYHMWLSSSSCGVALRIRKMLERSIPAFEMDIKEDLGE